MLPRSAPKLSNEYDVAKLGDANDERASDKPVGVGKSSRAREESIVHHTSAIQSYLLL